MHMVSLIHTYMTPYDIHFCSHEDFQSLWRLTQKTTSSQWVSLIVYIIGFRQVAINDSRKPWPTPKASLHPKVPQECSCALEVLPRSASQYQPLQVFHYEEGTSVLEKKSKQSTIFIMSDQWSAESGHFLITMRGRCANQHVNFQMNPNTNS